MTSRPTRVLQVITSTDRRGAEVFAVDLAEVLVRRGLQVRTVALSEGRSGARLPVEALGAASPGVAALRRLRTEVGHASVLVAHGSTTLPYCAVASAGKRVRFVYRSIGDPRYWSNTHARRLRSAVSLRRTDAVVALWPAAAEDFTRRFHVPPARIRVIPNGVAAGRFAPPSEADRAASRVALGLLTGWPVVLYLGALSPEKDAGAALEAVANLPEAQLLVVGDGRGRASLEDLARQLAPGRVRFTGAMADAAIALAAADVVVLPSRTEGIPAVAIEAGLCGLPVVATDVGGVSEVVRHGKTGFLCRPGDVAGMTALLRQAIARRDELGVDARDWCLPLFGMEPVADAWLDLLRTLDAAGHSRPSPSPAHRRLPSTRAS